MRVVKEEPARKPVGTILSKPAKASNDSFGPSRRTIINQWARQEKRREKKMPYKANVCEDEDDCARMAETVLRALGYYNVQKGPNSIPVQVHITRDALLNIARNAERIARWAREEARRK